MLTPEAREALAWLEGQGGEAAERVSIIRASINRREDELRAHLIADRAAAAVARVAALEPVLLALATAQREALEAQREAAKAATEEARARAAAARKDGDRRWSALAGVGESLRSAAAWVGDRSGHAVTLTLGALATWLALRLGVPLPDLGDSPPVEQHPADRAP